MMNCRSGYTLVEMMVVISIVAIIASMAIPSFRDSIQRNRVKTAADIFQSALAYARATAVSRGRFITLCPSKDMKSCSNSSDWEKGWVVFEDEAADESMPPDMGGKKPLKRFPALDDSLAITDGNSNPFVRFDELGAQAGKEVLVYLFHDKDCEDINVRQIIVTVAGYASGEPGLCK